MKKILFFLVLLFSSLNALEIDERKVDLYYANGIMMIDDKEKAQRIWQKRVDKLLQKRLILTEDIGNVDVSYNLSNGLAADMWEAFNQKTGDEIEGKAGWLAFKQFIGFLGVYGKGAKYIVSAGEYANEYLQHKETLDQQ